MSATWFCGVDEAGRGPLAGPVFAAAVILNPGKPILGLKDSKKLSARQRAELSTCIQNQALSWAIASASVEEIDQLNILQATLLAMQRAVAALCPAASFALVDGNRAPRLAIPVQTIIQGDATEPAISAASILAKTARDDLLRELDILYPEYAFAQHKGYATALHMARLAAYGPCPEHRRSFAPVRLALPDACLKQTLPEYKSPNCKSGNRKHQQISLWDQTKLHAGDRQTNE